MKFNSIQPLALLALATFFTSCEKAPNKGGGTIKGSCKVSAVTGYFTSPLSITYDSAGRIDTMVTIGLLRTYVYEEGGNKVTIATRKNNSFDRRIVLKYNRDSKLLDTALVTFQDGSAETRTYTYQNNNTIKEYIYSGNRVDTISYSWSGGNMINAHSTRGINPLTEIKYHTNLAFQEGDFNYMNTLIENGYVPVGKTANLVQCNYTGSINYKFNSNGYIKQVSSVHDGYPTINYTYEYTCK
ncbi:MAG: hypothetical protein EOP54_15435 [Sphingobacteriales bacterium]|nr:MAG: hypothetical protein EOP54_15435 [Sphingobacteriales bacterium]